MSPKIAQTIYLIGTIIPSILGMLLLWGGIEQGTADGIEKIAAGATVLLGAAAPGTAAVRVHSQRKEGLFTPTSPADAVVNGVQAAIENAANATAELDRVKSAVSTAINVVPGVVGELGPLASKLLTMSVPADLLRPDVD